MGVAGQVGEHRFGPGERRLGVDHPALLPDGCKVAQEGALIGETGQGAEEGELADTVELGQPSEE